MDNQLLYVQKKEKKTERLDLRVKPSTLEALKILSDIDNYHSVGLPGNFSGESISDILEHGLKMLLSAYVKHECYAGLYPDIEKQYDGLYGQDITRLLGPHELVYNS